MVVCTVLSARGVHLVQVKERGQRGLITRILSRSLDSECTCLYRRNYPNRCLS
jgi:hypothetical protein